MHQLIKDWTCAKICTCKFLPVGLLDIRTLGHQFSVEMAHASGRLDSGRPKIMQSFTFSISHTLALNKSVQITRIELNRFSQ